MKTFFIVVGAMFVGGILSLIVLWFGIKFLIRHFLKKLFNAIENLAGQSVPPFRLKLEKADGLKWKKPKIAEGVAKALEGIGYSRIGDFRLNEMPGVQLRALVNSTTNSYGVIAEMADKVILDIACDFEGGEHVTVSTAPLTGLDRPDFSRLVRVEADLTADPAAAVTLHERLLEEQRGRPMVAATAAAFTKVFETAHVREMDWRIVRGGVTAEEVRRSCEATGAEPPSEEAVNAVIQQWRVAISTFCDEQLRERFLKHVTKMSAAEWEDVRDRLYFVHDHSDRESVIESLADNWYDAEGDVTADTNGGDIDDSELGTDAVYARLRPLFAGVPVRQGFLSAQEMLPPERRYRRVAGIKTPYGADVYVEPESADDADD